MAAGGPAAGTRETVLIVPEEMRRHLDAVERQLVEDLGSQTGRHEATEALVHVDPMEDVLQQDGLALHALDLGDGVDDAGPSRSSLQLDETAHGHDDLFPDGTLG